MENEKKQGNFIIELIKFVITVVVICFIILKFLMMPVVIDGSSMESTLHDKDFGYSFIITKNLGIKRFDIVVIDITEKLLVKRVVGFPGETVTYKDNKLYINDEYVEEPFLNNAFTNDFTVILGDDEYYCLGDNRSNSRDSRHYGPFSKEQFTSTHIMVIYPFKDFGYSR